MRHPCIGAQWGAERALVYPFHGRVRRERRRVFGVSHRDYAFGVSRRNYEFGVSRRY